MTATISTLSTQYDPSITEQKWQAQWEEHQVFQADPEHPGEPFCVVIPPPNVTGSLHMGHAFENALIDTLVRYQRMAGRNTLWLPGTDHASIAVQTILERELRAQGQTRQDIGRERFLERAWEWKEESGGTIVNQLRKLGVSVDWGRERFTMDEGLSEAVLTAFNRLYEEGLIYRANYMVNWCPASQSAVSDLEVEQKDVNGNLWHLRYPFSDGSGYLEVATTRPETMLGDTAVAVNPQDQRYQHLIGKTLALPILGRAIPVIADEYVDMEFGTGCVKITPAHDPNDFEMGKRHNLPIITVMHKDGTMNEHAGPFVGMDRFEARKAVVQRLEENGCLVRVEDYQHTVPYSDRGKVPVEPMLSTQWFVKIRPLADNALDWLDNQHSPRFVPQRWEKVYRDWLVNLRDWCISRQLWWGHQIPAWYAVSETYGEITDETPFVVALNEAEAKAKLVEKFGEDVVCQQDPDVLDTWFSSGLWPFSTMGWPDTASKDYQVYYPTTTLVTGFDIIFFWVARMTMMAGHFTQQMPFKNVYIHGLVRDENNKKMSKSANNGIDPLVLINKYGTDALRYTLVREVAGAGQDIRLEYNRKTDESASVEASRNFTNKLWNASRFVMLNLDGLTPQELGAPEGNLDLADRWILSRYNQVVQQSRHYLDDFGFGEAAKELYDFTWGDFCDWYIELVKPRLQQEGPSKRAAQQTLAFVLDGILKLLHPFMPHITEEVWHTLTQTDSEAFLALQPYPTVQPRWISPELEAQFELLFGTVRTVRNLRAEAGIKPSARIETILETASPEEQQILRSTQTYIEELGRIDTLTIRGDRRATVETLTPGVEPSQSSGLSFGSVTHELKDFWGTMRPLLEEPWSYVEEFFSDASRPLGTLFVLFLAFVLLRMAVAVVATVESIPLLAELLQLVGIGYTVWFVRKNLWGVQQRQGLRSQISFWRREILGEPTPRATRPQAYLPAAEPATPEPVTEVYPPEPAPAQPTKMFAGVVGTVQVLIPLTGYVDVDALKAKLEKDLSKVEGEIKSLSGRLSNPGFVDKAPAQVVQGARDSLAESETQAEMLRSRLEML